MPTRGVFYCSPPIATIGLYSHLAVADPGGKKSLCALYRPTAVHREHRSLSLVSRSECGARHLANRVSAPIKYNRLAVRRERRVGIRLHAWDGTENG